MFNGCPYFTYPLKTDEGPYLFHDSRTLPDKETCLYELLEKVCPQNLLANLLQEIMQG